MSILQYLNDTTGQSDYNSCRQHIFRSIQKLLNDSIRMFTISKAREYAHR